MTNREADSQQVSVARGTFLGARADVATAVSMVVVSIVVSRALGPEGRGVFFLASLLAMYVALIGDLGISTAGLVFGANRRVPLAQIHGVVVCVSMGAGVAAAAVLLPLEPTLTDTVLKGLDVATLALACAAVPPLLYAQATIALLTGLGRIPVTATARICYAVAYPVAVGAAAVGSGSATWSLAAWLLVTVGYAVGVALYTVLRVAAPVRPSRWALRTLLSFGVRGYLGTLSYHGFLRVDILFLSARYGPALVGIYSLASVVAERISLIGQAVYAAGASRMGSDPREEAAALAARIVRMLLLVGVPVAAVVAPLAWPLFPLAFGADFADAALPFALLLPGTLCLMLWSVVSLFIVSTLRRPGTTTVIQGIALLVSLPLFLVAVREAEMTGAALVSSAVYASVFGMGVVVMLRNSRLRVRDLLPRRADLGGIVAALRAAGTSGARA